MIRQEDRQFNKMLTGGHDTMMLFRSVGLVWFFLVLVALPCWAGGIDDLQSGLKFLGQGHLDNAISFFTKAIDSGDFSGTSLATIYYTRATCWNSKEKYERALADFTKAITANPKHVRAYHMRGVLWNLKGQHARAIADFTEAIRIIPLIQKNDQRQIRLYEGQLVRTYNNRALTYTNIGNYDKAIEDFTKVIKAKDWPGFHPLAYAGRSAAYDNKGDPVRALADFEKFIKLVPENPEAVVRLRELKEKLEKRGNKIHKN